MKKFKKKLMLALILVIVCNTKQIYTNFSLYPESTIAGCKKIKGQLKEVVFKPVTLFIQSIWNHENIQTTTKATGATLKIAGKAIKNSSTSLKDHIVTWFNKPNSWSATIKKVLSHHNDPRLLAMVISLGIVSAGGVYMLARRKQSKLYEKIIGIGCILFGIANIALSSHWIRLIDAHDAQIKLV
ncbi:hypothetical protein KC460_04325 [Candidatus Dependentiae bacterium]|nr:hypothetical protein [Candidatus Dependentiae bacterium]